MLSSALSGKLKKKGFGSSKYFIKLKHSFFLIFAFFLFFDLANTPLVKKTILKVFEFFNLLIVPPQPRISSSGCAAITRILLFFNF